MRIIRDIIAGIVCSIIAALGLCLLLAWASHGGELPVP